MRKSKLSTALVSFGNYVLSKERKERFKNHPEFDKSSLEERLTMVHDADLANWSEKQKEAKG